MRACLTWPLLLYSRLVSSRALFGCLFGSFFAYCLSYPAMRDPLYLSVKNETSKSKGILLTGERTLKRTFNRLIVD